MESHEKIRNKDFITLDKVNSIEKLTCSDYYSLRHEYLALEGGEYFTY